MHGLQFALCQLCVASQAFGKIQLGFDLGKDFAVLSGLFQGVFAAFPTLGAVVLIFLLCGSQIGFYAVYRGFPVLL